MQPTDKMTSFQRAAHRRPFTRATALPTSSVVSLPGGYKVGLSVNK